MLGVFVLVAGFLTVSATTTQDTAEAATGSDFNPGNIISDAVFYNPGTMTRAEIQSFLNARVPNCRSGYVCLKNFSQATSSQGAKSEGCKAYAGSSKESGASIIAKVAAACGINPQVLLVLLEKEQGLVTDSWPSSRQYRSATGYGCPDTADCDASYYGFFNQVYNAAYQFKKYQASPNSRGYVAGRWNSIQWHPNAGCGSTNVYIENQATAALYIYTPYRPNEAALGNLYGTGDGCSSYGNRNFWRMFPDWFGNTKGGSSFVRDSASGAIFLIAGTVKHHVPSTAVYNTLSKLGKYRNVSSSYLKGYTDGTAASPLVRNPLTGDIALVQGNSRHRFTSCSQVSVWGYDCGSTTDLMPAQWSKLPTGGEVSNYMVVSGKDTTYFLNSSTRFPVSSWTGVVRLNGGKSPWVGTMGKDSASRYPVGRTLETPGTAIKASGSNDVFLVDGRANRIRVPSMAMLGEYGVKSVKTVSKQTVDGYNRAGADLTLVASCNSKLVLVNNKKASRLSANNWSGIPTTKLDASTCRALGTGTTIPGRVFVKSTNSDNVYRIVNGKARAVLSWGDALSLNGGKSPTIVNWSSATIKSVAASGLVASGSLIKSAGSPHVYLTDGVDRMIRLGSFGTTDGLGIRGFRTVPDSVFNGYAKADGAVTRVVTCNGQPYIGLNGTLYRLKSAGSTGMSVTKLHSATCGNLKISKDGAIGKVFVKASGKAPVYYLTGGKYREVTSWAQLVKLNGGSAPKIFTISSAELWSMANGGAMPK